MAKTLRDLVEGYNPEPTPTLRDHAAGYHTYYDPQGKSTYAHMPGDNVESWDEFELDLAVSPATQQRVVGGAIKNPIPELGPLGLSRALREGTIPPQHERQVRAYLAQYERYTGDTLYNPRHHNVPEDEITGGPVHHADPYGSDDQGE